MLLSRAWCPETAYKHWNPQCPAQDQCAVTALVVQDYLGGTILRCQMTNGGSHYLNMLENGDIIDFTEDQFNHLNTQPIQESATIYNRNRLLRFKSVIKRYLLLKQRVENQIN